MRDDDKVNFEYKKEDIMKNSKKLYDDYFITPQSKQQIE